MISRNVTKKSEDLFFVSSSDWEVVVSAPGAVEAATKAVEERLKEFPRATNLSTIILALNISKVAEEVDAPNNLHILYAPRILANAGMHEESKQLQQLIEEIKVLS